MFSVQCTSSLPRDSELDPGLFQSSLSRSFPPRFFGLGFLGLIRYCFQEEFEGEVIHAFEYTTAKKYVGKKVIVVGTGTSGHDVAFDLANHEVGQ